MKIGIIGRILIVAPVTAVVGLLAIYGLLDSETRNLIASKAYLITFVYLLPLSYAIGLVKSLQSLISHKALKSEDAKKLGTIVKKRQLAVAFFFLIYLLSACLIVLWTFIPAAAENYNSSSYFIGVYSVVFSTLSLVSFFLLKLLDFEITDLTEFLATKEKEDAEKKEEAERRKKALELLEKADEFSESEKLSFSKARTVDTSLAAAVTEIRDVKRVIQNDCLDLKKSVAEIQVAINSIQKRIGYINQDTPNPYAERGDLLDEIVQLEEMVAGGPIKLIRIEDEDIVSIPFSKPL
jgi:TRAP-type mannitol/chloroaromatic compound transport system permease small subunit